LGKLYFFIILTNKMKTIYKQFLIALLCLISPAIWADVNDSTFVTWPFNLGTAGQTATFSTGTAAYYNANWVALGSNLSYYSTTKPDNNIVYTAFQPTIQDNTVNMTTDYVSFNLRPKTGLKFTPASISFDCERFGTSGGLIDAYWVSSDGTSTKIATGIVPARNGTATVMHAYYNISGLSIPASGGDCALYLYIYSLGNTKQVGVANVVVKGITTGSLSSVKTHTLGYTVSPAGAGTITNTPQGNVFDEGTNVTLTAATRSFGYTFKEWQDSKGNVLSATSPFTFSLQKDTNIVAIYKPVTTYNFTVNILGSKWGKVSLNPTPTNGKYESGTNVQLNVVLNPVTKFGYWDDSSTSTSRTILVDADKTVSATFDEASFITGWDFQTTTPTSVRPGDYYSDPVNMGTLNGYNQAGTVTAWSATTAAFSPSTPAIYLNTPAASFATDRRYFKASFSTKGYKNIFVKSQMAGNNQHYLVQKLQVSLNDTVYTDRDTVQLSTTSWRNLNDTLPAAYEGKDKIYVRWMADATSTLVGSSTAVDGTYLTNVFIFADKAVVLDTVPPTLLSTVPAENATNASANGSIVLTFDEKLMTGTGNCTLESTVLTPSFGSKTVTFAYTKLTYNTSYVFTVPAGALTDLAGNPCKAITIHFKTMNRPVPTAKVFDAVVAKDGTGNYTTVQAAIDAAPSGAVTPYLIFIKNGTYNEHVDMPAAKPMLHLIGQYRDSVVITDTRLSGSTGDASIPVYSVDPGATVVVKGSDCYFENITFENGYGYSKQAGPQALAVYTNNDKMVFKNCWMRSYQDTYLTASKINYRGYLTNCRIEGAVDFIYGMGDFFFDKCTIYCVRPTGGYIVAPNHPVGTAWGYVFSNCTLDGNAGVITYLGRPWHDTPKTSFFNTITKIGIYPQGWWYTMGGIPAIFADYNTMDASGSPIDLSNRISQYQYTVTNTDGSTSIVSGTAKNSFTAAEAATYTYENVVSGSDSWDPRTQTEATDAPVNVKVTTGGSLSWDATPYAISYVILKDNKVVGFTTSNAYTDASYSAGATYKVTAVAESGALSTAATATKLTAVDGVGNAASVKANRVNNKLVISNVVAGSEVSVFSFTGTMLAKKTALSNTVTFDFFSPCIVKARFGSSVSVIKVIE
jgi:pectin methylesterase-like acyl-CoA thioesterase